MFRHIEKRDSCRFRWWKWSSDIHEYIFTVDTLHICISNRYSSHHFVSNLMESHIPPLRPCLTTQSSSLFQMCANFIHNHNLSFYFSSCTCRARPGFSAVSLLTPCVSAGRLAHCSLIKWLEANLFSRIINDDFPFFLLEKEQFKALVGIGVYISIIRTITGFLMWIMVFII